MKKIISLSNKSANFRIDISKFIDIEAVKSHFKNIPNPYLYPEHALEFIKSDNSKTFFRDLEIYVRDAIHKHTFLFFENTPIDTTLPETPGENHAELAYTKKTFISEAILLVISNILGKNYSFSMEFNNQIVHQVRPIESKKATLTSLGSTEPLGFHQEVGFTEFRPEYIILLGLKPGNQHEKAFTNLLFNLDIINRLTEDEIHILSQPWYKLNTTPAFEQSGIVPEARKLIERKNEHYEIHYMANSKIDIEAPPSFKSAAQNAFSRFENIATTTISEQFAIQPGQLLLIKNGETLHSRTKFTPNFSEPTSLRWLQRVYVTKEENIPLIDGYLFNPNLLKETTWPNVHDLTQGNAKAA